MGETVREYLFISYATEDGAFAEWLALRLSAEGYRVWCDRIKLLGGESYPRDIDDAIKRSTYRFLAVLSSSSLLKPNPLKERTLALSVAAQRKEPFVIPLNLTGLSASELDWMTADLTFIPFHHGWADGLARLLKALEKAEVPKALPDGRSLVAQFVATRHARSPRHERLWSNVVEVSKLPRFLLQLSAKPGILDQRLARWPRYRENDRVSWVFEIPQGLDVACRKVDWRAEAPASGIRPRNVAVNLVREYIRHRCLARGLKMADDGTRYGQLYFTPEASHNGWLSFDSYDGTRGRVKAIGERRFWVGQDVRETTRYHLAPLFVPMFDVFDTPSIVIRLRLQLTDHLGTALPLAKAIRRRKAICRNWWNYEWLARVLAVSQWLTHGDDANLALTDGCEIRLSPTLRQVSAVEGIDEAEQQAAVSDDETDIVEQEEEEDGPDE